MKKNQNDKEKEKLKEVIDSNFVQLDESLTESKDSKIFETEKGKLDFNIDLNKNDDIIIEDNNEYNKNDKTKNDLKSNAIQVENKFDKKPNKNTNNKDQVISFSKINNKENLNNKNNNRNDFSLTDKNIELNVQQENKVFYNSSEKMKNIDNQQVKSPERAKNKLDISFNNMIYDTLDEPVCDTIVR